MRGYADVEVDEFLDEVADEFERIFKENIDLRDRLEVLEDQVAGYKRIEETLQKTLISAQASADELKQNSTREAQLIVHEARAAGAPARQRGLHRAAGHRAGDGSAAQRRAGLPLQVPPAPAGLPGAHRGGAPRSRGEADARADRVRAARRGRQAGHRARGAPAMAPRAGRGAAARRTSRAAPQVPRAGRDPSSRRRSGARDRARPLRTGAAADPLLPGPDEVTAGHIAEYMPPAAAADPSRKMPASGTRHAGRVATTCWPTSTPG